MSKINKPDILDEEYEMPNNILELQEVIDDNYDTYKATKNPALKQKLNQLIEAYNTKRQFAYMHKIR